MRSLRRIALGAAAFGLGSLSLAQITGPTPLAWRWTGFTSRAPQGAPVVAGDTVFVGVGSRVVALDRLSGNRKWQYPAVDPIDGIFNSNLIQDGETIIASASDKRVYAVNASNGEIKWTYEVPGVVIGKMAISGRLLLMNVDANSIMAISLDDGKPVFINPERIFNGIRGDIFSMPNGLYYFDVGGALYNMNPSTRVSNRVARFQGLPANVSPAVSGNSIIVASGTFLTQVDSSGSARWNRNLDAILQYGPASNGESVVAVDDLGKVFVLDSSGVAKTRREGNKNVQMVIDLQSRPIAPPSVVGKLFAIPTANGAVNLVDPSSGTLVWSYIIRPVTAGLRSNSPSGGTTGVTRNDEVISVPASGPAVLAGKSMMILAGDGSLLCFDAENGVDLTGPSTRLIWPNAGQQVGTQRGPFDVYFQLADEAVGINEKSVQVMANGNPVESTFGRDGVLSVRFGPNTKNGILPDGRVVIEVVAKDWLGNESKTSFSYTVDNTLAPLARPGGLNQPGGGAPGGGGKPGAGGGGGLGGGR